MRCRDRSLKKDRVLSTRNLKLGNLDSVVVHNQRGRMSQATEERRNLRTPYPHPWLGIQAALGSRARTRRDWSRRIRGVHGVRPISTRRRRVSWTSGRYRVWRNRPVAIATHELALLILVLEENFLRPCVESFPAVAKEVGVKTHPAVRWQGVGDDRNSSKRCAALRRQPIQRAVSQRGNGTEKRGKLGSECSLFPCRAICEALRKGRDGQAYSKGVQLVIREFDRQRSV